MTNEHIFCSLHRQKFTFNSCICAQQPFYSLLVPSTSNQINFPLHNKMPLIEFVTLIGLLILWSLTNHIKKKLFLFVCLTCYYIWLSMFCFGFFGNYWRQTTSKIPGNRKPRNGI